MNAKVARIGRVVANMLKGFFDGVEDNAHFAIETSAYYTGQNIYRVVQIGLDSIPKPAKAQSIDPKCNCTCRECAEDDHCGEGHQEGLGDCFHLLKERDP